MVTLKAFGKIAEVTGWQTLEVDQQQTTLEWRQWLETQYPALKGTQYAMALNQQMVSGEVPVNNGSELAFLPPFSGG